MRVCNLHIEKAIITLKSNQDGSEFDLCPACWEMVMAAMQGMYEEREQDKKSKKPKEEVKHAGKLS